MTKLPADPEWQPITKSELIDRIQSEAQLFGEEHPSLWDQYRIPLTSAKISSASSGDEQVLIVARRGDAVLYFDDSEDEFAIGRLVDGSVIDGGLIGELRHAISILAGHDA